MHFKEQRLSARVLAHLQKFDVVGSLIFESMLRLWFQKQILGEYAPVLVCNAASKTHKTNLFKCQQSNGDYFDSILFETCFYFFFPESVLHQQQPGHHPRPLPDLPTDETSLSVQPQGVATLESHSSTSTGGGGMHRWTSRENLLTAASDEDPHLFVALYDFQVWPLTQFFLFPFCKNQ